MDPTRLAAKGVAAGARGAGKVGAHALGWTTGAKGPAIEIAAKTGYEASRGKGSKAIADRFRDAMRGLVPMDTVVDEAKDALGNMRRARGDAYQKEMYDIKLDDKVLPFGRIQEAMAQVEGIKSFKGRDISKKSKGVRDEIRTEIEEWGALDPAEFHTAGGLDALKQQIGEIFDSQPFGTPERKVAGQVYDSIKKTITEEFPEYAAVMKDYEDASGLIRDIEKSLSLGHKTAADTSLRKLQSILRNDVSSGFGKRAEYADELKAAGADKLFASMAGQATSSYTPRGLATIAPMAVGGGALTGNPAMLAALPAMSPRIVGEAVHAGGRAAGRVREATKGGPKVPRGAGMAAYQGGRASSVTDPKEAERRARLARAMTGTGRGAMYAGR